MPLPGVKVQMRNDVRRDRRLPPRSGATPAERLNTDPYVEHDLASSVRSKIAMV
jgi:hypothetical protein